MARLSYVNRIAAVRAYAAGRIIGLVDIKLESMIGMRPVSYCALNIQFVPVSWSSVVMLLSLTRPHLGSWIPNFLELDVETLWGVGVVPDLI